MQEDLSEWRRRAIVFAIVSQRLGMFAATLIAYGLRGRLDAARLAQIRAQAVLDLKNANASGFSIDEEAEIIGKAIEQFEQLVDGAIAEGGEAKDR